MKTGNSTVLSSGRDFYAAPRLSADGSKVPLGCCNAFYATCRLQHVLLVPSSGIRRPLRGCLSHGDRHATRFVSRLVAAQCAASSVCCDSQELVGGRTGAAGVGVLGPSQYAVG